MHTSFRMSPITAGNWHFSHEKSFDECNHYCDSGFIIKGRETDGFFRSHFLPIPSISDSFFFLYGFECEFFLETNYYPDILDIPVEKEQTLPVYVPRFVFLRYSEELQVIRLF